MDDLAARPTAARVRTYPHAHCNGLQLTFAHAHAQDADGTNSTKTSARMRGAQLAPASTLQLVSAICECRLCECRLMAAVRHAHSTRTVRNDSLPRVRRCICICICSPAAVPCEARMICFNDDAGHSNLSDSMTSIPRRTRVRVHWAQSLFTGHM